MNIKGCSGPTNHAVENGPKPPKLPRLEWASVDQQLKDEKAAIHCSCISVATLPLSGSFGPPTMLQRLSMLRRA